MQGTFRILEKRKDMIQICGFEMCFQNRGLQSSCQYKAPSSFDSCHCVLENPLKEVLYPFPVVLKWWGVNYCGSAEHFQGLPNLLVLVGKRLIFSLMLSASWPVQIFDLLEANPEHLSLKLYTGFLGVFLICQISLEYIYSTVTRFANQLGGKNQTTMDQSSWEQWQL